MFATTFAGMLSNSLPRQRHRSRHLADQQGADSISPKRRAILASDAATKASRLAINRPMLYPHQRGGWLWTESDLQVIATNGSCPAEAEIEEIPWNLVSDAGSLSDFAIARAAFRYRQPKSDSGRRLGKA
ncbi:MAG: hypothetical protein Q8O33_15585 [Pseudomonadota bacterium]|nr:hypothetical protein [Pseudomonadota bacterium]